MEQGMVGAWHLANRPDIYEPMRTNHFDLIVHGIDNLVRSGSTTDDRIGEVEGSNQEVIRFSVTKASIPNFEQNTVTVKRGNTTVKFAGTMTFADGSMEVVDYIGADSLSILMAWQRLSGDIVNETVGRAKDYKKQCTLNEYTPDFELVRSWDIYGAWVSKVSATELNNEANGDVRKITGTIVFDKAVLTTDNLAK